MPIPLRAEFAGQRLIWILFGIFSASLVLGGGGSRADIQSLVFVRPMAVLLLAAIVWQARGWPAGFRGALTFAAACVLLVAIQLLPLPPSIWTELPGREFFADAAAVAGIEQMWRPLSLTPDATLNALTSLLPPIAFFIATMLMRTAARAKLLVAVFGIALFSAVLGAFQVADGHDSGLRFYRITNESSAVGLFANRNHQAALLAISLPILAWWLGSRDNPIAAARTRYAIVAGWLAFLAVTLAITGSRAGLVLAAFAAIPSVFLLAGRRGISRRFVAIGLAGLGVAILAVTAVLSRFEAFQRIVDVRPQEDLRFQLFGDFVRIAQSYFPFGSGFGSFPNIYRHVERSETLGPNYVNHAHMEVVEVAIEGGVFALALIAWLLGWWILRSISIWRQPYLGYRGDAQAKVGTVITGTLILASLADYPLRTPMLASLFAFGCVMMLHRPTAEDRRRPSEEIRKARATWR